MAATQPQSRLSQRLAARCLRAEGRGDLAQAQKQWASLAVLQPQHPTTSLLAGILAFSDRRYRDAERHYWEVLEKNPGDLTARAFLAEALIAQRRWNDAHEVIAGLAEVRGQDHPALLFADSLRRGFEVGLYQRVGPFP